MVLGTLNKLVDSLLGVYVAIVCVLLVVINYRKRYGPLVGALQMPPEVLEHGHKHRHKHRHKQKHGHSGRPGDGERLGERSGDGLSGNDGAMSPQIGARVLPPRYERERGVLQRTTSSVSTSSETSSSSSSAAAADTSGGTMRSFSTWGASSLSFAATFAASSLSSNPQQALPADSPMATVDMAKYEPRGEKTVKTAELTGRQRATLDGYTGVWNLVEQDSLEELLQAQQINPYLIGMATRVDPVHHILVEDNMFHIGIVMAITRVDLEYCVDGGVTESVGYGLRFADHAALMVTADAGEPNSAAANSVKIVIVKLSETEPYTIIITRTLGGRGNTIEMTTELRWHDTSKASVICTALFERAPAEGSPS